MAAAKFSVALDMDSHKITNVTDPTNPQDAVTKAYADALVGSGGVTSLKKTGSTALTGNVTLTGGTNVTLTQVGQDISIAATGSSGVTYGTPAIVLGTAAANGSTDEAIRRDSTIIAFDATVPVTQAFGDSAATGSAAVAARRDHKHAMPAVDNSTVEINSATLRVKAGGIGANEIASTAVTPATYGDSSHVGQFTVDADGRLTAASSIAIPGVGTGGSVKLYDFTITGSDAASIDTNVDGTTVANFAGYDILDVYFLGRTDQATTFSQALCILNNDTGAKYDLERLQGINAGASAGPVLAASSWLFDCPGASYATSYYTVIHISFPFYTGTTAFKTGTFNQAQNNSAAGTNAAELLGVTFRDASALTRVKFLNSSTFKFKVGSRLLIYGR